MKGWLFKFNLAFILDNKNLTWKVRLSWTLTFTLVEQVRSDMKLYFAIFILCYISFLENNGFNTE